MSFNRNARIRTETVTVSVRPAAPRSGNTHAHVLNGSLLRDVLVDGKWVTVQAADPSDLRTA
ncbi:hypothetical protein LJ656_34430 [Paraburkholderia sp. MMS20-SJTR3]|uniref:Uncharacterized protein n=1 Tax=Paraburkholderia sejongensis TaxID=2886946 RepID=A0ABS8K668_9BURK|nr:hypothetical protein [Paraburkholderia sp. MMS20-SJTR3]MCC8397641.1 hypothetical protein [Paraburkholderia sp. MMS20-SJTR3]